MNLKASQNLYIQLQQQVEKAQKLNQPIDNFVKQQIKLLEETHDEFVSSALSKNKDLESDLSFTEIRIKQLQAIASLCKKIGLSTEKFVQKISVQILSTKDTNNFYYLVLL